MCWDVAGLCPDRNRTGRHHTLATVAGDHRCGARQEERFLAVAVPARRCASELFRGATEVAPRAPRPLIRPVRQAGAGAAFVPARHGLAARVVSLSTGRVTLLP